MPRADLTITIPERIWMGDLSRRYPDAEFEILTVFPKGDGGVALAEVSADDVGDVLSDLGAVEEVVAVDVLERSADSALVQFETSDPVLLFPIRNAGTPLELPFTVTDGHVDWEITAARDRLSSLADQLREFGIDFDVVSIRQEMETEQLLTPKQLRLVRTAIDEGYYDTPRDCTLTELADELDIAKSTCSETLHRAEEKIVKQFVEDGAEADDRSVPLAQ